MALIHGFVQWLGWWNLLFWPLVFYYLFLVTWIAYAAIMSFRDKMHLLEGFSKFNAYVALFTIGYPLDVLFNAVASVVLFLNVPRAPLFTGTLKHWIRSDSRWRAAFALWICEKKLDPFDKGHCT